AGCALLPPFVECAGWASAAAFPWVCLLSGAAGLIVITTSRRQWLAVAVAVGLLVVAFLTYQPAAMFMWVVVGVAMATSNGSAEMAMLLRRGALVTGVGLTVSAAVALLFVTLAGSELSARVSFVQPQDWP